eukprot:2572258-Pyramimonas_sp.AAC.1
MGDGSDKIPLFKCFEAVLQASGAHSDWLQTPPETEGVHAADVDFDKLKRFVFSAQFARKASDALGEQKAS